MQKRLLILLFLFVSCSPQLPPNSRPWANALRALDPADTPSPAHDITAVYLRQQDEFLQIRIDLLDYTNPNDLSLDIKIEDDSAPQAPPFIIHIPSQTNSPRITLDPLLATVIADIPLSEIPSRPRVDVSTPEDEIHGLTLDGPIPTQSAPLLLTFYDTFAARTPAEALRSWDGAHSGPRGERHGLKHLLDAAKEYQVPIVLLDLKEPASLSALDAMTVLWQIDALTKNGLLILPENDASYFGLPVSSLAYNQTTGAFQFAHLEDGTHLYHPLFSDNTYLPIAAETDTTQPTPDGPSLEVRRALLETALNNDENDILVLGGSLANSTWGSPNMIGETLAYFASRPYIKVLDEKDLLEFPTRSNNAIIPQPDEPADETTLQIQSALEFAKTWAENPSSGNLANCESGRNQGTFLGVRFSGVRNNSVGVYAHAAALPNSSFESAANCVLANENYLAIFDAQTASLTYLFTHDEENLHQLIGPSWQVAPSIDLYPGAFGDDKEHEVAIVENTLIFSATDGTRVKIFKLDESGLDVTYQTQEPVITQIPLLVDPETRFTPGWAQNYTHETTPNGIRWGLGNGLMVSVQAEGPITMRAFNESLSLLTNPEDPDFAYPSGHYVPFPMALLSVDIPGTVNSGSRLFLSVAFP